VRVRIWAVAGVVDDFLRIGSGVVEANGSVVERVVTRGVEVEDDLSELRAGCGEIVVVADDAVFNEVGVVSLNFEIVDGDAFGLRIVDGGGQRLPGAVCLLKAVADLEFSGGDPTAIFDPEGVLVRR